MKYTRQQRLTEDTLVVADEPFSLPSVDAEPPPVRRYNDLGYFVSAVMSVSDVRSVMQNMDDAQKSIF